MRRFHLVRSVDVGRVSGTGHVASGVQFPDGSVALRWHGPHPSTVAWGCIEDVIATHGHNGNTEVVWLDEAQAALDALDAGKVWVIGRREARRGWVDRGRHGYMVNVMVSTGDTDAFTPAEAREFAADYLAAADEAQRLNGEQFA